MAARLHFELLGRHMDGTRVIGYEIREVTKGTRKTVTREQMAFLVGKGVVEGVMARLYQQDLIIEAAPGYRPISELPIQYVNGQMKANDAIKAQQGARKVKDDFDNVSLIGRRPLENGQNCFVVSTARGQAIITREQLIAKLMSNKVVNARVQTYNDHGVVRQIIRMTDKTGLNQLPIM